MPSTEYNRCSLDWREAELAMFLLIFIAIKNRNAISWEQSMRRAMTYCKLVSCFLFFRVKIEFGILFSIICLLRIKFFNEDTAKYSKMTEHIVHFTDSTLEETLKADHKVVWIIEAFTNWSNECIEVAPVFSDLAMDYGHEFLRFGKIDVGKFGEWSKNNYISNSPMSKQLPSMLTYQGGKVVSRRPEVKNKRIVKIGMGYEDLERELNLKTLYREAKGKKGKAKLPDFVPKYSDEKAVKVVEESNEEKKTK